MDERDKRNLQRAVILPNFSLIAGPVKTAAMISEAKAPLLLYMRDLNQKELIADILTIYAH
jgi:hypothetical protein